MPTDLTEVLERTVAPTMHVDPLAVVAGGRRRRLRRRVTTGSAALAVLAAAGAGVLAWVPTDPSGAQPAGRPATGTASSSGHCAWPNHAEPMDIARGSELAGRGWLDSGVVTIPGFGEARLQVNAGTCDGLELGLMTLADTAVNEQGMAATTGNDLVRPLWQTTVSGDPGPNRRTIAAVVLPDTQRVCGFVLGKDTGVDRAEVLPADTVRAAAGQGWHAEFQVLPNVPNPQGATARLCTGKTVTESNLRQVSHIDASMMDPVGGSQVAQEDGSILEFDRDGNLVRTIPPTPTR